MKNQTIFSTAVAATLMAMSSAPVLAQDSGDKPRRSGGLFNRLFQDAPEIEGEAGKVLERATSEATRALEGGNTEDMLKQAAEAFRANEDEIVSTAEKALEDPSAIVEQGEEMLNQSGELQAAASALTEEVQSSPEAAEIMEQAAQAAEGATTSDAVEAAVSAASEVVDTPPAPVATPAPEMDAPISLSQDLPPAPAGIPAPQDPVTRSLPQPQVNPEDRTRITSKAATFDANTNEVEFQDDVKLDHPDFVITCDILNAELEGDQGNEVASAAAAAPGAVNASGIRRATARGYVVIQRVTPDGEVQVAKSRVAIYEAATGDVLLTDFPILQDGKNLIEGTSESTRIWLRQSGVYDVEGEATYDIVSGNSTGFPLQGR